MQVWIFNPFDNTPDEGKPQRFHTLADALAARGHEVVWWSSDFSHRRKGLRYAQSEGESKSESESEESGSRCLRGDVSCGSASNVIDLNFQLRLVATPPYSKNVSLARIWSHRVWGNRLFKDGCSAIKSGELLKPDVILASLPPMEGPIAALRLRRRYGCRVVMDIMDAWPETLLQAAPSRHLESESSRSDGLQAPSLSGRREGLLKSLGRLALWPYERMLRRACRESDAVSAQSQTFADFARQHGANGEMHVCYLGAERMSPSAEGEDSEAEPGEKEARACLLRRSRSASRSADKSSADGRGLESSSSALRVVYIGAMGRSYDLETLLTATVHLLRQGRGLELHIAGGGEKEDSLKQIAAEAPAGAIQFHGFLQAAALSDLLLSCDVGVVPMFPACGVAVPYKVGDYLSAGLAVVNSLPGELDERLQAFQCGRFYEARSLSSMNAALSYYLDSPPQELGSAKENAKALYTAHFDRAKTYPAFANWLMAQGKR